MPDFNGDGLGDLVVGAPLSGTGQTGRVYAYYGVRGGLPSVLTFRIGSPFTTDPSFGSTVASAGDVNGDGYADLLVGAPRLESATAPSLGALYVYRGRPDRTSGTFGVSSASKHSRYSATMSVAPKSSITRMPRP